MDERREFVRLAGLQGANRRELCRRFGISAETGYKWLSRAVAGELSELSRRPLTSPWRSSPDTEQAVLDVRLLYPAWGARVQRFAFSAKKTLWQVRARLGFISPELQSAYREPITGAEVLPSPGSTCAALCRRWAIGKNASDG